MWICDKDGKNEWTWTFRRNEGVNGGNVKPIDGAGGEGNENKRKIEVEFAFEGALFEENVKPNGSNDELEDARFRTNGREGWWEVERLKLNERQLPFRRRFVNNSLSPLRRRGNGGNDLS
ncbi:MAG: hypothetical protein ACEY26_00540 [Candidatus Hodgkinia cicadicola]